MKVRFTAGGVDLIDMTVRSSRMTAVSRSVTVMLILGGAG